MRLHDAENGLNNIEEENTLLRKKCQEYEEYFVKHRFEFDELLNRYNEAFNESSKIPDKSEQIEEKNIEISAAANVSENEKNSSEFIVFKFKESNFFLDFKRCTKKSIFLYYNFKKYGKFKYFLFFGKRWNTCDLSELFKFENLFKFPHKVLNLSYRFFLCYILILIFLLIKF